MLGYKIGLYLVTIPPSPFIPVITKFIVRSLEDNIYEIDELFTLNGTITSNNTININTNNFLDFDCNSIFLGDIVISSDTLIKEANNEKKIEEDHLIHLFIHGVLHLLGYDHETSYDAKIMETLEIKILKCLNINNPYKEII